MQNLSVRVSYVKPSEPFQFSCILLVSLYPVAVESVQNRRVGMQSPCFIHYYCSSGVKYCLTCTLSQYIINQKGISLAEVLTCALLAYTSTCKNVSIKNFKTYSTSILNIVHS